MKTTISLLAILIFLAAACAPKGNPVYNPQIIRACPVKLTRDGTHYCAWDIKDVREIYKLDAELSYYRKYGTTGNTKYGWFYLVGVIISGVVSIYSVSK